jgi:hypothetical protein
MAPVLLLVLLREVYGLTPERPTGVDDEGEGGGEGDAEDVDVGTRRTSLGAVSTAFIKASGSENPAASEIPDI